MSDRLINGDWFNGCERETIINQQKVYTNDTGIKARFFEHEIVDTKNSDNLTTKYRVIVKCDVKCGLFKDMFSALIKKNSDKYLEMTQRFPKSWENFLTKGGGFNKKPTEVKNVEVIEPEVEEEIVEAIEKPINDKITELKKEYENLEDKRSARGKEIREEIKKLEG